MAISWYAESKKFKSPLHVVAAFLFRSRETQVAINQRLREEAKEHRAQLDWYADQLKQHQQKIDALDQRCAEAEKQRDEAMQSVNLPEDRPIGTHGYGARMVSLAINLARSVGFRGAERVLQIVFKWFGLDQNTPAWTSIRNWMQRLGIAELERPLEPTDDMVVLVDHSNQIGTEKVFVVLGIRASKLPPPGEAIKHEDVRVLKVEPASEWKKEDVTRALTEVVDEHGPVYAVVSDGAPELQDGAKCLENGGKAPIVLRDFKHYAANVVKSLIGNDERFKEVEAAIGQTRSAIQQTELAHLRPPTKKPKSRFMNLAATLRWAMMIVWLLKHPEAKGRQSVTSERMTDKLGWVASYAEDFAVWQECQEVVSASLTFINQQGLYRGASGDLRSAIGEPLLHATSKEVATRLTAFVAEAEAPLREGERLPMSTEILESSFGLFKQLEGQHSKGGFTSLLASFPALLKPTTPDAVCEAFARVSHKAVKKWVKENLGSTLTSRRQAAYAEYKNAIKRATLAPAGT